MSTKEGVRTRETDFGSNANAYENIAFVLAFANVSKKNSDLLHGWESMWPNNSYTIVLRQLFLLTFPLFISKSPLFISRSPIFILYTF